MFLLKWIIPKCTTIAEGNQMRKDARKRKAEIYLAKDRAQKMRRLLKNEKEKENSRIEEIN